MFASSSAVPTVCTKQDIVDKNNQINRLNLKVQAFLGGSRKV